MAKTHRRGLFGDAVAHRSTHAAAGHRQGRFGHRLAHWPHAQLTRARLSCGGRPPLSETGALERSDLLSLGRPPGWRRTRYDLRGMTSGVIDSMTGHRHGRLIGKALGLAAQQMKRAAMSILKSFAKIADRFGSATLLLTAAFLGAATALIGG